MMELKKPAQETLQRSESDFTVEDETEPAQPSASSLISHDPPSYLESDQRIPPPAYSPHVPAEITAPRPPRPSVGGSKAPGEQYHSEFCIGEQSQNSQKALLWAVRHDEKKNIELLLKTGISDAEPKSFRRCLKTAIRRADGPFIRTAFARC